MADSHDVIEEYIDIINNDVLDPNSTRRSNGLKWIYDDTPLTTLKNKYPRISVLSFGSPVELHEVGSSRQRVVARIEVQIRVSKSKFKGKTPPKFLSELSQQVIESLRTATAKTQLLDNVQVFETILETENTIDLDDVKIRQLIYKNTLVR